MADWTPPPTSSASEPKEKGEQATGNLSAYLDFHLNKIFGPSFAPVVEFETRRELGVSLCEAFKAHPSQAVEILVRIFKREEAVRLILDRLTERLGQVQASPQNTELLRIFEQLRPIVIRERIS
ncbi:MAG TPA: hypothetical protein VKF15_00315 [Nitrososphaerales archaeon]|nr:hypothetical protein [Nitrososphaerales archaeon]